MDIQIVHWLASMRTPEFTNFLLWVTSLGEWQIVVIFVVATILAFWIRKKRFYIIPLLVTVLGSELFSYLIKIFVHRTRPDVSLLIEDTYSFPSGHATISIAFYGFITYVLIKNYKKLGKIISLILGILLIGLIGFSRLYLGVHYTTDVLGGYIIGGIWLVIGIYATKHVDFFKKFLKP